ncbi:6417_t:CDS:2 [Dentiscutata erythropus]|uniref:6417_t:CDS:1 n=1 Tax=Dentiscutata erythropus TaxID=1348616 RepID=A0A9N9CDQ5_9GLOM|nr:6417_t:CDS:2 [Dentiscutata erythropus]
MTATPAPVTSNEHDSHLFHNTRNRIASLSSKNKEILDQISQLHQSHSQALSVINSQLDIPHSTTSTVQDIDNLVNNLNLTSRQRRNSNLQQQSVASVRPESSIPNKNVISVIEVEKNNELETTGSIDNTLSFTGRSSKISIANRNSKDSLRMDSLSPNANNVGELDWKYLLAEHNSDSENANEISGSVDDKEFKINDDSSNRRRSSKSYPTLTINTKSSKPTRLITPESSDSEFDISNAHMPLASSLGGGINPLRVPRHSSAELYKGSIIERRGRPISMTFSSMDEVIEEERGSLSDIAEQEAANVRASDNSVRTRNRLLANRKKRGQKYADDFNEGTDVSSVSSVSRTNKINNRLQADEYSATDIHDDNSSIMSNESFVDELNALRSRIQKLEAERVNIDDDSTSEKRSRKKKSTSDQAISPSVTSPAFTTSDQSTNDASPPPSHSMAMVVSTALYLNSNLRNVTAQMESGGQPSEKYLKVLLKTSDEQIRSLTECLLALGPLALKKAPTKKDSCSSLLQTPTTTRSISPIQRIPSTSSEMNHHEIHQGVDHSVRRISPTPPTDLSSPTYYTTQRTSRYRISRPPSPGLPPENLYDSQFTQAPSSRAADYRERRNRRYSGSTYGGSYSGPFPPPSSSPPPPVQSSHYDQSNVRSYLDREIPRLQRYNNSVPPTTNTTSYQRSSSRPTSLVQDSSYNVGHMRSASNSSLFRSSSGRSITQRGDEFVNSPVSTSRQPRTYEYTRRYQSENGQSQFDRRQAPVSEMDRRYGRRVGGNYEPDEVFDGQNGYGDHISDRDYALRREDSNNSTGSIHKQRSAPPPEEQIHNDSVESREESRNESQDEIRNDGGQEGRQVDNTNNDNVVENGGYI